MKLYYTYNQRKCELIEERGVEPLFFCGDRTYYKFNKQIKEALEEYDIERSFYEFPVRRRK